MCINDLCDILNKASVLDRVLLYNSTLYSYSANINMIESVPGTNQYRSMKVKVLDQGHNGSL